MIKRVLWISLAAMLVAAVALTNYHRFKSIDWRPATDVETFEVKIGQSCQRVHEVLADRLNRSFRGMRASPAITLIDGPGDEDRWVDPERSWAGNAREVAGESTHSEPYEYEQFTVAPELQRYFDLPPDQRKLDWMLLHADERWDSEYYYRGAPAPFVTNFIVHLRCDDAASTTVEIYEYGAQICVGEWYGLHGSHGHLLPNLSFGFHPDCRLVAATRVDRADLLRTVQEFF